MHNELLGAVIVLTGSSGFLGEEYVQGLTNRGATVIGWDTVPPKYGEVKNFTHREVDVVREDDVERAVREIREGRGVVHGLINNAALNPAFGGQQTPGQFNPYTDYPIDLFRREVDTNLTGPMITTKHVGRLMQRQGFGSIVNVASEVSTIAHDHRVYDEEGKYKSPAYVASKAGILGLTRQCAAYFGQFGVRVNALSIGAVAKQSMPEGFKRRFAATNMLGRMARSDEYVASVAYLLSDASSFMTGANLVVDGGKSAW